MTEGNQVEALKRKLDYINRNTEILIGGESLAEAVNQVMQSVREYYDAARTYLFEVDEDTPTISNTYEICAPGVRADISRLQQLPLAFLETWKQTFEKVGYVLLDDVSTCDDRKVYRGLSLRDVLLEQGIQAMIAVPIVENGEYRGFFGIDNPNRSLDDVDFLITMVRYITIQMAKHRASEGTRQLEKLIHSMPNAFILFSVEPDGELTPSRFSPEICRILGGTEEDCIHFYGQNGYSGVHPEDRSRVRDLFLRNRNETNPTSNVYRVKNLCGEYIWFKVYFMHTRWGGKPYLYVSYTNVNELKHREEELLRSYYDEQSFVESVSDSYLFTARVNVTQDVIEAMWGTDVFDGAPSHFPYSQDVENMVDHIVGDHQKALYRQQFSREALLASFATGTDELSGDYYYINDKGNLCWAHCRFKLIQLPVSNDVIAFISEADITREKILKSLMDNVVTNQYDYVMVILGRTKRTNVISLSQREADTEDIHDTDDYDSAVQAYADRYCLPEERDRYLAFMDLKNVWQALETQPVVSQNFCFLIAGRLRYKMLEFYCIDQERELLANVRTDFTDMQLARMDQEEKLREALRQAQQAAIAKDDFLSRMSHDIRTPLNGILGMTTLAQRENQSPMVGGYLEKIDISGHFLLGLVNDILDMSKISAGKMELHPEPYSEIEFVQYINSVIRPLCDAKGIHFHLPQGPSFCCSIMIDKLKYNQIFFNILSNAVKFTPPGGNVTLKVVNPQREGNRIESDFHIIDDGIGMSNEFQKRLFQPFEQENTARNDARDGTGLGLAIAKKLVDLMGGTIQVRSEIDKGSTFILHFTFTVIEEEQHAIESQALAVSLRGYHVLVVEDNEINGEILMAFVAQQGMVAELACDGVEAVGRFKDSAPSYFDAILMDVRMPVMDGLEATRRIRSMERSDAATVPIIAITANAYADDVRECLEAGMDDHIAKPVEPKVLFEKLRHYIATVGRAM